jgi:hypothetical protein
VAVADVVAAGAIGPLPAARASRTDQGSVARTAASAANAKTGRAALQAVEEAVEEARRITLVGGDPRFSVISRRACSMTGAMWLKR